MYDEMHFEASFPDGEHTGILKIGDETIRVYLCEINSTLITGDLYFNHSPEGSGWLRRQTVKRRFVLVEDA